MHYRVTPDHDHPVGRRLVATIALVAMALAPYPCLANPLGGMVSGGNAAISSSGKTLTINQSSNNAIIDWSSFNVNQDEKTKFIQPSSNSMTLNRINDVNPSQILGTVTANGTIVLVNPNGVFFGKSSTIDVGSLVASTANISNQNFMAGNLTFNMPGTLNASIINDGSISAKDAGLVGFVAPEVENNGTITVQMGKVTLASGDSFTMDMAGDNLINVAVSNNDEQQLASNSGTITANGGTVTISAAAAKNIVSEVVNNTGTINATSFKNVNGKIVLYAAGSNAVVNNVTANKGTTTGYSVAENSGTLNASGLGTGQTGGTVEVLGDKVGILNGSTINTSGDTGGGTVHIGGARLGQGITPAAVTTFVDYYTIVYNDAVTKGNGGTTTIWSDGNTYFYGNVYARGGQNGGNGGFVETSGHGNLTANGYVDLTALEGTKGTYLLDPSNITIYGNVTPTFQSTDGTINLASSLQAWLDASDPTKVQLTYSTNSLAGATVTGTSGSNTITTSANVDADLAVGARIRLGSAGNVAAASTLGSDTYTISDISGDTITLSTPLTANYTGSTLYRGLISEIVDKSATGNNAIQLTAADMPLWVSNGLNGMGTAQYNGTTDALVTPLLSNQTTNTTTFVVSQASSNAVGGATFKNGAAGDGYGVGYGNGTYDTAGNNLIYLQEQVNWYPTAAAYGTQANIVTSAIGTASINNSLNGNIVQTVSNSLLTPTGNSSYIGGYVALQNTQRYFSGSIPELLFYNTALTANETALLNQYESAKYNIALTPPGTGATEAAQAMAANGYSVFTTGYLQRLSNTADIALQATNNITLDLQGDNLALAGNRSLSLTAVNGNITSLSTGTITTTRQTNGGNISMNAGGLIDISNLTLNATNGGTVTLVAAGPVTLGTINAGQITAQTTASTSDLTIAAGSLLNATDSGTAITLASGQNFINNEGSDALTTASGSWQIYSTNPAHNVSGNLASNFNRYSCSYGGNCPDFSSETGNGMLYSFTPMLTITPTALSITYGDASPALIGYGYTVTAGYLASDSATDIRSGAINGTTNYTQGSNVGNYGISYSNGSLTSSMGYGFIYASNASAITVGQKTLTISGVSANDKTFDGSAMASLNTSNASLNGIYGSDTVDLNSSNAISVFNDNTVGMNKAVTASGFTIDDANYIVSQPTGLTASINAMPAPAVVVPPVLVAPVPPAPPAVISPPPTPIVTVSAPAPATAPTIVTPTVAQAVQTVVSSMSAISNVAALSAASSTANVAPFSSAASNPVLASSPITIAPDLQTGGGSFSGADTGGVTLSAPVSPVSSTPVTSEPAASGSYSSPSSGTSSGSNDTPHDASSKSDTSSSSSYNSSSSSNDDAATTSASAQ